MSDSPAEDVADSGAPRVDKRDARRRYHELLLAAFVAGSSVEEAARQAGVSRRTAQRWKAIHWGEVTAARRETLDGLLASVRKALPVCCISWPRAHGSADVCTRDAIEVLP